jgi:hypothetical protein
MSSVRQASTMTTAHVTWIHSAWAVLRSLTALAVHLSLVLVVAVVVVYSRRLIRTCHRQIRSTRTLIAILVLAGCKGYELDSFFFCE